MEEDEDRAIEQSLIEDEMARKEEELRVLQELSTESGFTPRQSLARTPPSGFATPPNPLPAQLPTGKSKRALSSPEEVQEAVRRRVTERRRVAAPPIGGILTVEPRAAPAQVPVQACSIMEETSADQSVAGLDKLQLLDMVYAAIRGIALVTNDSKKMNILDKTTVSGHSQNILAAVAALELRLADAEHQVSATKLRAANSELEYSRKLLNLGAAGPAASAATLPPVVPSYANALKLPKGKAPLDLVKQGPAVIFYPVDETIKTSEETKKMLQQAVKPGSEGIKIRSVRMVGNSGIVVRTANAEAATKLKEMVPPNLKVAEPKTRQPRVALRYLRANLSDDEIVENLHRANLMDDPSWPLEKVKGSCKVALKKSIGPKFLVILECSMSLRETLVGLGTVYIGWDEAEVSDHIRATCCNKCQQYGHPEKYCRSKELVCGKCGDVGHKSAECQAATQCCATCKRFKRKEASTHFTAAINCPARQYAEQQAVNALQYG